MLLRIGIKSDKGIRLLEHRPVVDPAYLYASRLDFLSVLFIEAMELSPLHLTEVGRVVVGGPFPDKIIRLHVSDVHDPIAIAVTGAVKIMDSDVAGVLIVRNGHLGTVAEVASDEGDQLFNRERAGSEI